MRKEKVISIALTLLSQKSYITINNLAKLHKISEKTIRNYIEEIDEVLGTCELKRVQGKGLIVEGPVDEKLRVSNILNSKLKAQDVGLDYLGRKLALIYYLLVEKKQYTINDLEEILMLSRPSVYKIVDSVEKWLNEHDIKLMRLRGQGFCVNDGEKRIRIAIFKWLLAMQAYNDSSLYDIATDQFMKIPCMFYNLIIDENTYYRSRSNYVLSQIEKKYNFMFVPVEFRKLSCLMSISVKRFIENDLVSLDKEILNLTFGNDNNLVGYTNELMNKEFGLSFSMNEAAYIAAFVTTSKTNLNYSKRYADRYFNERDLSIKLANIVYEYYNIKKKAEFEKSLALHLYYMINKIVVGKDFYNPMKDEIKKKLPNIYKLVLQFVDIIEGYTHFKIPDDEVAYLALHVSKAIEQSKVPLRTLFVYNQSYAEAKFAIAFLKNNCSQIDIVDLKSYREYERYDLNVNKIDLVLSSSAKVIKDGVLTFVIPPIIGVDYLEQIVSQLWRIYEEFNKMKIIKCKDMDLLTY